MTDNEYMWLRRLRFRFRRNCRRCSHWGRLWRCWLWSAAGLTSCSSCHCRRVSFWAHLPAWSIHDGQHWWRRYWWRRHWCLAGGWGTAGLGTIMLSLNHDVAYLQCARPMKNQSTMNTNKLKNENNSTCNAWCPIDPHNDVPGQIDTIMCIRVIVLFNCCSWWVGCNHDDLIVLFNCNCNICRIWRTSTSRTWENLGSGSLSFMFTPII